MVAPSFPPEDDVALLAGPATNAPCPRGLGVDVFGLPPRKPLWRLNAALDVINRFEAARAAMSQGQFLSVSEAQAGRLVPPGVGDGSVDLIHGPGTWRCERKTAESWTAYVSRCADAARAEITTALFHLPDSTQAHAYVDLAWVTQDELALFDLPRHIRAAATQAMAQDDLPLFGAGMEAQRVRCAGRPARGSHYGPRADSLDGIPREAHVLHLTRGTSTGWTDLPEFSQLELLSAWHVNQKSLEALGKASTLRVLSLSDVRADTLEPLTGLRHLECLSCFAVGKAVDLRPLARLPRLRVLAIGGRAIDRLADLQLIHHLRGLRLLTGGPGAPARLPSLAPLSRLTELRHLSLGYVRVDDRSLRPLTKLTRLRRLQVPNRFPVKEFARLAAALPHVEEDLRSPFHEAADLGSKLALRCKTCRDNTRVATRGQPRKWFCRRCNAVALQKHVAEWELLLADAKLRE